MKTIKSQKGQKQQLVATRTSRFTNYATEVTDRRRVLMMGSSDTRCVMVVLMGPTIWRGPRRSNYGHHYTTSHYVKHYRFTQSILPKITIFVAITAERPDEKVSRRNTVRMGIRVLQGPGRSMPQPVLPPHSPHNTLSALAHHNMLRYVPSFYETRLPEWKIIILKQYLSYARIELAKGRAQWVWRSEFTRLPEQCTSWLYVFVIKRHKYYITHK